MIHNLSKVLGGTIGLEMGFKKWKVAGDHFEVLSVNCTLNQCAAKDCEFVETHRRY